MTVHDLANSPNRNEPLDGMLLYFSKPFDKVPHQRLLENSAIMKFVDTCTVELRISKQIENKKYLVLEGKHSSRSEVTSGVPRRAVFRRFSS